MVSAARLALVLCPPLVADNSSLSRSVVFVHLCAHCRHINIDSHETKSADHHSNLLLRSLWQSIRPVAVSVVRADCGRREKRQAGVKPTFGELPASRPVLFMRRESSIKRIILTGFGKRLGKLAWLLWRCLRDKGDHPAHLCCCRR